ncbi:unnamed protein product [Allacma fusca]|uniref:Cytochrome P450 n=1 Tax=Allacma fusca TaxID=39272 RepID=A0A8J2KGR1_9HEXA|nr:unnamed protein product [Allacma fusca]
MVSFLLALLGLAAALVYYFLCNGGSDSKGKYPPAPRLALPFIGHLHLLGAKPHVTFLRWSQKHGKIFSAQLGQYKVLVINGHKEIQLVLNDSRITGRPQFPLLETLTNGPNGIQNNRTESWNDLRRFTLHNLKGLGIGRGLQSLNIQSEIAHLQGNLSKARGPVDIKTAVLEAMGSSVWEIVAGQRLEDEFVLRTLRNIGRCVNKIGVATYFPHWSTPLLVPVWKELALLSGHLAEFQHKQIEDHVKSLDPEHPRDFIDLFIMDSTLRKQDLVSVMNEFLIGGCLPTAWTLAWAILYLSVNPDVQDGLQEEIDSVLGSTQPTMEARPKMPLAIAVLMETLRKSSFFPLGVFHSTTEDMTLFDFQIPKDTIICANLYSAHHDVEVWTDPDNFRPSRFIAPDGNGGKKLLRNEASIPFSTGKRSCVGELMAKELLFLYLTSLFQKFTFRLSNEAEITRDIESRGGFLSLPPDFNVVVTER